MPRITTVEHARKSPGNCGKCNKPIGVGDQYRWWKPRYGGKRVRCTGPACSPRPSELTTSDKLSRCYGAGESIEDAIGDLRDGGDIEDLRSAMEGAAADIREVAEEYRESAQNIEDGFNGNRVPMCDELEEKADNLESKADEIESAASELEEFDEEESPDDPAKLTDGDIAKCVCLDLGIDELSDEEIVEMLFEDQGRLSTIVSFRSAMGDALEDMIAKKRADLIAEKRKELKDLFDAHRNEWIEEQAGKCEEFTDIDPEG